MSDRDVEAHKRLGTIVKRERYASGLLRAGLSPVTVAERLGHSDGGKTVMATYAHVWHDDDARTRSAVEAMLTDVG